MSASRPPRLTPEQYLEMERAAEFRHEYFNGQMYAMAGGSY
jgi:Uma2 family endonuclease